MSWSAPPPDPTNPDLLDNIRQYLINNGVVRDPRDGTNTLPPLWISPRFGAPAPGQTEGIKAVEVGNPVVAALDDATDIPPARYEGFLRNSHVTLEVRARTAQQAKAFENQVRALLNDKRGWMMVNVPVNESLLYRGFQPISRSNLAFTFQCEYTFVLWGPFTPVGE